MDQFALAGLQLAKIILTACSFGAGVFAGVQAANKLGNVWGWVVGLIVFAVVGLMLAFATAAIDEKTCKLDALLEECV